MTKKVAFLTKELAVLKHNLKGAFSSYKDEFDMHLDSINQNTNEIQSNYEQISELNAKIEKLSDRLDELNMKMNPESYSTAFKNFDLSRKEKEVFLGIYTEADRITIEDLSRKLGVTHELCTALISSLRSKGIPVVRQMVDDVMHISLDYYFKDMQARKNVLKIDIGS